VVERAFARADTSPARDLESLIEADAAARRIAAEEVAGIEPL